MSPARVPRNCPRRLRHCAAAHRGRSCVFEDNPVPSALDHVECMDAELVGSPVTSSSPGADAQLKVFSHDDCASQLERRERTSVGVVLRSQLSRFDWAVRQPVMEAPAEVLPATVAPAECATNDAAGVTSCKPIVSLDASASVVLRITAQLRLSACSLARGKITEARPVPLLANENLSPSVADALQAQRIGGLGCGHPLRAYDPGDGLHLQSYDCGKEEPSRQLLHGSSPAS